jgi:pimeloyl-ACP methyl ester carboxylesterase
MNATVQSATRAGHYVNAGGLRTYYEVEGEGDPLILLHGGLMTVETWDAQTPALASTYRVYVPERRGHGRTPDVEGPITYDNMAHDTIAFMEALNIESAHLVGWSDGALVGLIVALRRPDLVRKLVFIGQPINLDDARPEALALMEHVSPAILPPMLKDLYATVSPDGPDHFEVIAEKAVAMWRVDPGIPTSALEAVAAPMLILAGDDDFVSIEQAGAMLRALPNGQLGIVPGTSHQLLMEKPDIANRLILDFLAVEQTPKLMPLAEMAAAMSA